MRIIRDPRAWKETLRDQRKKTVSIGFVPTMGALHRGHMSLIERSIEENDVTAVSIFLNPTQFNNADDLKNYPSTFEEDCRLLEAIGVELLFTPTYDDIYADGFTYQVNETELTGRFCGAARPGHFTGVLTIVLKLLILTAADRAYFGEKDWQQYRLIDGMAKSLFLDTQIIPCELIREESGLALSSRNALLSLAQRKIAPYFHQIISSGITIDQMEQLLVEHGFRVDYIEEWEDRLLAAVFLGEVRLIDNVRIS
mgnify:CR=1 FL=1